MRTTTTIVTTTTVLLTGSERFTYVAPDAWEYLIHRVDYVRGESVLRGRRIRNDGVTPSRRVTSLPVPARDVPEHIATAIRGSIRAQVGEQARALGIVRWRGHAPEPQGRPPRGAHRTIPRARACSPT
jgi:hypothetical protein